MVATTISKEGMSLWGG